MIPKPKSTSGHSPAPSPRPARQLPEADPSQDAKRKARAVKLFEVNAKPADGLPAMPRRPQRSWRLWGLALLAAGCGALLIARAQQPDQTPDQTTQPMTQDDASQSNTPMESDDQSNSPVEVEVIVNSNSPPSEFFSTNSSGRRFRRSYRRRSGTGNANMTYNEPASGGETNANGRANLSVFSIITRNNIFDPNRRRGYEGPIVRTRQPASQYFALRGTASLGNDTFAVFDGTSSDYHKDVRVADTIADYKIVEITPDAVKLASGTNQIELRVGMQMRREDQGPWTRSESSQAFASTSATASNASGSTNIDPPISGPESDVLKRLMKQREQE